MLALKKYDYLRLFIVCTTVIVRIFKKVTFWNLHFEHSKLTQQNHQTEFA